MEKVKLIASIFCKSELEVDACRVAFHINNSQWTRIGVCDHDFTSNAAAIMYTVTMKTFGLLSDRAWIWLDFPDFKHYYIKGGLPVGRVLTAAVRGPVIFKVTGTLSKDFESFCDQGHLPN